MKKLKIFGFEITIVPASGPNVVHKLQADYTDTPLGDVLKAAGLKLDGMQITTSDGTPVDPATFKLTASVEKQLRPSRQEARPTCFYATERSSGS